MLCAEGGWGEGGGHGFTFEVLEAGTSGVKLIVGLEKGDRKGGHVEEEA